MALPNLLASRPGRLALFTGLYLCEGLPQGFAAVAVPLELKRMGLDALAIGAFSAAILSPWASKWVAGPLVDNLRLPGFGRRKQWIVACQALLVVALIAALVAFPTRGDDGAIVGLALFTSLVTLTNACSACQDVAIDALAVETLEPAEKGSANGLMFGAAQAGIAIGGSGVLLLKDVLGFSVASLLVPAGVAAVLTSTALLLVEPVQPVASGGIARVGRDLWDYVVSTVRAFLLTSQGLVGLALALLPFGGMALSLTVSTIVTPTLGMTDDEIGWLNLASSLVFVVCCVAGGFLSDRFGRRRTIAVFALGTLLPTLWIASVLDGAGFLHPPEGAADGTWPRQDELIVAWWVASLSYGVFQGLMYGVRSALFMDLADRRVAATQFTAFMALLNLVTMYSYAWQGAALESWGLTVGQVMRLDCAIGALFVLLLPFARPRP
jgi:PAT family beta-lactamase induction signal transducer AmpG